MPTFFVKLSKLFYKIVYGGILGLIIPTTSRERTFSVPPYETMHAVRTNVYGIKGGNNFLSR